MVKPTKLCAYQCELVTISREEMISFPWMNCYAHFILILQNTCYGQSECVIEGPVSWNYFLHWNDWQTILIFCVLFSYKSLFLCEIVQYQDVLFSRHLYDIYLKPVCDAIDTNLWIQTFEEILLSYMLFQDLWCCQFLLPISDLHVSLEKLNPFCD